MKSATETNASAEAAAPAELLLVLTGAPSQEKLARLASLCAALPAGRPGIALPGGIDTAPLSAAGLRVETMDLPARAPGLPWVVRPLLRQAGVLAASLGARAVLLCSPDMPELETADGGSAFAALAAPVLSGRADLAVPRYVAGRYEGFVNTGILAPALAALFGRWVRVPQPFELAASPRFLDRVSAASEGTDLPWPGVDAQGANLSMVETYVPFRHELSGLGEDLAGTLQLLLGSLFSEIERHAADWQRVRGVAALPPEGHRVPLGRPEQVIDLAPLRDSFLLGQKNLPDVWSLVLPPVTLLELRRLSRLPAEQFLVPDELWARILYDFALAYRRRTLGRTHLFGALVPLYLGWLASWVRQISPLSEAALEQRQLDLVQAFERSKPYFVSRWRWPDRFNP
jgi:hypothetical protein